MKVKIAIIGGGNMGEAILARVRKGYSVCVAEKDRKRCAYLKRKYRLKAADIEDAVQWANVVVLAVKPQSSEAVLKKVSAVIRRNQLFISIAAGVTTSFIEKVLGKNIRVVRTMPNMPALIGEGITAVCKGKYATAKDVTAVCKIFNHVGTTVVVHEKMINSVTAVSGSGPAYVFFFVEALTKAAGRLGLKGTLAKQLVESTFLGSIHLLAQHADDAGTLRSKVTSKGGTTQAAMDIFMKKNTQKIIIQAFTAAEKRAKKLSRG